MNENNFSFTGEPDEYYTDSSLYNQMSGEGNFYNADFQQQQTTENSASYQQQNLNLLKQDLERLRYKQQQDFNLLSQRFNLLEQNNYSNSYNEGSFCPTPAEIKFPPGTYKFLVGIISAFMLNSGADIVSYMQLNHNFNQGTENLRTIVTQESQEVREQVIEQTEQLQEQVDDSSKQIQELTDDLPELVEEISEEISDEINN